jgi:hypothetical protein
MFLRERTSTGQAGMSESAKYGVNNLVENAPISAFQNWGGPPDT